VGIFALIPGGKGIVGVGIFALIPGGKGIVGIGIFTPEPGLINFSIVIYIPIREINTIINNT
jgi:hypothetical protein